MNALATSSLMEAYIACCGATSLLGLCGDWFPIGSAPRDGSLVVLTATDWPVEFYMRWRPDRLDLLTGEPGVWAEDDDGATWSTFGDTGPTHWNYA